MPVQLLRFLSLFLIRDGQLCVVYSRWHGPRLESNAAMGFVKTTDARMRFESLYLLHDKSDMHIEGIIIGARYVQLCVIYSRWHRPRLGLNAAIGFGKIIDGRMRFEGLLVITR